MKTETCLNISFRFNLFSLLKIILLSILLPINICSQSIHFNHLNTANGLSDNTIYDILQDKSGFIWLATADGLNRFDGYEFRIFHHDHQDENSISDNSVLSLREDSKGNIWIGTKSGWINCYDPVTEKMKKWKIKSDITEENNITFIYEDSRNKIWIGTYRSGLYRLDPKNGEIDNWLTVTEDSNTISNNYISSILEDNQGNIWISTYNGLNKFNPLNTSNKFIRYFKNSKNSNSINDNIVWQLSKSESNPNLFWIGTANGLTSYNTEEDVFHNYKIDNPDNLQFGTAAGNVIEDFRGTIKYLWIDSYAGLVRLNLNTGKSTRFTSDKNKSSSLISNQIHRMIKDRSGVYWLATNNGLSSFSSKGLKFNNTLSDRNYFRGLDKLNKINVNSIAQTTDGRIWFGTSEGIFSTLELENRIEIVEHPGTSGLNIWSICTGFSNDLWIGTYGSGLFNMQILSDKINYLPMFESEMYPRSVKFNKVVYATSNNDLWIGYWGFGLVYLNPETGEYKSYLNDPKNNNTLSHNDVWVIYSDSKSRLWIGTNGGGLNLLLDKENGLFKRWISDGEENQSLSSNRIYSICESVKNNDLNDESTVLWIGTDNGLNKFVYKNTEANKGASSDIYIEQFQMKDGFENNIIKSILEDNYGNLWLATNSGISFFDPKRIKILNFNSSDGIRGTNFNYSSSLFTADGMILIGSTAGIDYFYPDDIEISNYTPSVLITDFQIFNQSIASGENSILTRSILFTDRIELSHSQNVFSFQYVALDYSSPQSIQYAHKMEGFDDDWVMSGTRRFVTYTNLDPGEYIFKVKSTNSDGTWQDNLEAISIVILPPWWQTFWAIGLYVLIFILGIWGIIRFQTNRTRLQHELKTREFESHHLREVESMKSRFFANLSHEFRTPLMLIKGPLEQLISGKVKDKRLDYYKMALRNTEKLQNLIDELLELSQLEMEQIPLNRQEHNIVNLLQNIASSFNPLAEQKNISFSLNTNIESLIISLDKDKLEKIINNLLSNAFKFTYDGGAINIDLNVNTHEENPAAIIMISDTGIGISEKDVSNIFNRFYQVDDSSNKKHYGSGIGLALVKELVSLHNWQISVSSEVGKGTSVTLNIPLSKQEYDSIKIVEDVLSETNDPENINSKNTLSEINSVNEFSEIQKDGKPVLLFVEDSEDVRNYINYTLGPVYNLLIASNAKEGMELAVNYIPDLILSDIMMPEIDGIEFCNNIKTHRQTSHIPVILLTAKATDESKIEGLESGADDYMTKPFNMDELLARINNLIQQRKLLREIFSNGINVKSGSFASNKLDKEYLHKVFECVNKNLNNPSFDSEHLAKEMFVSRRQLHRKLLALTGHGPGDLIRTVRLKQAALMIKENKLSITQIAYDVGFGSPSQFSRAFKKQFNCLPSEFNKSKRDK